MQKILGHTSIPYHIFLTGGAGTGKSHVIQCIFEQLAKIYIKLTDEPDDVTVLKVVPTGTAAFNIQGLTIHSAFSIHMGSDKPLGENEANTLRKTLRHLQLLIIDEISMVSQDLLLMIHKRLQQIKQLKSAHSWFGDVNILAVGDFHQVLPVMGKVLYKDYASFNNIFISLFSIWNLEEIMRQKDDSEFAQFLNRLRTHTDKEIYCSLMRTF